MKIPSSEKFWNNTSREKPIKRSIFFRDESCEIFSWPIMIIMLVLVGIPLFIACVFMLPFLIIPGIICWLAKCEEARLK